MILSFIMMLRFTIVLLALLLLMCLQGCNAYCIGEAHTLKITATSSSPPLEPSSYRAGSALNLSCEVEGVSNTSGFRYEWTSTCVGKCFAVGKRSFISTPSLHSYDSGVYTCTIYNSSNSAIGSANASVDVVGAGIHVQSGGKISPENNLMIQSSKSTIIFQCISGSTTPYSGNLIGPSGDDIQYDPFFVRQGGPDDPGTLLVRSWRQLRREEFGTYVYRTEDRNGSSFDFSFEIYPSNESIHSVAIEIDYTSPGTYPQYFPPNYRPASSVTLKCVATGATGNVTYQWSSTCSSCFASEASTQTISEDFLRSRDAGTHTCTVRDGNGNVKTSSAIMNIVGVGIYVSLSHSSSSSSTSGVQGPQPDNSYHIIESGHVRRSTGPRFSMYCCSNTSLLTGNIVFPSGVAISDSSGIFKIRRYTGSNSYAGCIEFYIGGSLIVYLGSAYSGIYTCNVADNRGNNHTINIGLYDKDSSYGYPAVYPLLFRSSSDGSSMDLTCQTRFAPPSIINWYRNGALLNLSDSSLDMSVTVTDRRGSLNYFNITLNVRRTGGATIAGEYGCEVGNRLGHDRQFYHVGEISVSSGSTSQYPYPSETYPHDPYEPYDAYDPYPFQYCELNEDEYGRSYFGPYDEFLSRTSTYRPRLPDNSTADTLVSLRPPSRPRSSPSTTTSLPPRETYAVNVTLLRETEEQALSLPSCIIHNECSQRTESCSGSGTQYDSCGRRCTCRNRQLVDCCRVRKEWHSLTQVERCRYVEVFHTISTQLPWKTCYDQLVQIHRTQFGSAIHEQNFFFPWHRWFILSLENLLRRIDCTITVPYWDWSAESQTWQSSTLWADQCGLGGSGRPVTTGAFRSDNWQTTPSATIRSLHRNFRGTVPDCAAVAMIQRMGVSEFSTWHGMVYNSLHSSVHCIINGTMCTRDSANAPEFFLHHGFIDYVWANWQNKGPAYKNLPHYARNTAEMPGAYGTSPRDVYNLNSQPGCVHVCIQPPSRPCRANTSYTPICAREMSFNTYSPIKLADLIPRPYPEVPPDSYRLFNIPPQRQRISERGIELFNTPADLGRVLESNGYYISSGNFGHSSGEIQLTEYIYQLPSNPSNGTALPTPPPACQPYVDPYLYGKN